MRTFASRQMCYEIAKVRWIKCQVEGEIRGSRASPSGAAWSPEKEWFCNKNRRHTQSCRVCVGLIVGGDQLYSRSLPALQKQHCRCQGELRSLLCNDREHNKRDPFKVIIAIARLVGETDFNRTTTQRLCLLPTKSPQNRKDNEAQAYHNPW